MASFPSRIPAPLTIDPVAFVAPRSVVIPPPPKARGSRRVTAQVTAPTRALTLSESRLVSVFEEGFEDAKSSLTPSEVAAFLPRRTLGSRLRRVWLRVRALTSK